VAEPSKSDLDQAVARHRDPIYRYVLGIVRDPAAAEDVTQETLLRAHRKLGSLEDVDRLSAWLYRIASNICRDRFRAAAYRHRPGSLGSEAEDPTDASPADVADDTTPRLDKALEQREMSGCVQGYLTGLSDPYRAVIVLHDVAGLTNPEIAQMLGTSLATVKIRLHRARSKLRAALAEACSFSTDERGVLVCDPKSEPESG
jgi:RNA polymerase sigma-70 factor (ECF subfamily)